MLHSLPDPEVEHERSMFRDKEDKSNKCDKKSNKNGKLNFLDSFNSLDMISQRKLGKFLDENSIKVDHSSNTINNDSIMIDMDSNSEATGFKVKYIYVRIVI